MSDEVILVMHKASQANVPNYYMLEQHAVFKESSDIVTKDGELRQGGSRVNVPSLIYNGPLRFWRAHPDDKLAFIGEGISSPQTFSGHGDAVSFVPVHFVRAQARSCRTSTRRT